MSDQNQMAISPVVAGATGTVLGGAGGYFIKAVQPVKSEFKEAKGLLTMEQDTFNKIESEGLEGEVKNNYDTFVSGRKEIETAEANFEETTIKPAKEQYEKALLESAVGKEEDFSDAKFKHNDKTISELQAALDKAKNEVPDADVTGNAKVKEAQTAYDTALGKKVTELETTARGDENSPLRTAEKAVEEAKANGTYEANQAALDKAVTDAQAKIKSDAVKAIENGEEAKALTAAREAAKGENAAVKTAKEALEAAKEDRLGKIEAKIKTASEAAGATPEQKNLWTEVSRLKKEATKKFDKAAEADELLRDTKYSNALDKIKGILPKAKMWPTIIGAAALGLAGVALAYIVGPKNDTPSDVA